MSVHENKLPKFKDGESVYFTQLGGECGGIYRTLYFLRIIDKIKSTGFGFIYKFQGSSCFIPEYVVCSRAVGDSRAKKDPEYHKIME